MVADNEPSIKVNRSCGIKSSHKPEDVALQAMTILLHEFHEVPKMCVCVCAYTYMIMMCVCVCVLYLLGGLGMRLRQEACESSSEPNPL